MANNPIRWLLVTMIVFSLVAASVAAPAVAQDSDYRNAELAIQQPTYADAPVEETTDDGRTVYTVRGESFQLAPQNFRTDQVVDYGIDSPAGVLEYDSAMDLYQFDPEGNEGTFEVYWAVNEQVEVDNGNATETVQRRYEAVIQVDGQADMTHLTTGEYEEDQEALSLVDELDRQIDDDLDADKLVAAYHLRYDTFGYFTGNYTQIAVLLFLGGIGGAIWLVKWIGGLGVIAYKLRGALNEFVASEALEGSLSDRAVKLDRREAEQRFATVDHTDWKPDTDAAIMRELGETPRAAWRTLLEGPFNARVVHQAYLQAMGDVGYTAVVKRDGKSITDVELLEPDEEVSDDVDTADLTDRSVVEDLIPHVDGSRVVREFDFAAADFDDATLDIDLDRLDPEHVIDAAPWEGVGDEEYAAELLSDLFERVAAHPYTDDNGEPRTLRVVLNELLDFSYRVRDGVGANADMAARVCERALDNADPNQRVRELDTEVRQGVAGD